MRIIFSHFSRIAVFGVMLYLTGCGSSALTGTSVPGGPASIVVNAVNSNTQARFRSRFSGPPTATNTNNGYNGVGVSSSGIMSGAPLGMYVYLQSISLTQSNNSTVSLYSNTTANTTVSGVPVTGCKLALTSGNLDLTTCAGLSSITVPAGTYTGTVFTFAEVGEVQGCLRGQISNNTWNTAGTFTYPSPFPQTPVSYTTDATSIGTTTNVTFCTRSDKYYYQAQTDSTTAIGANSDFENSNGYFSSLANPDYVTIDLTSGNFNAATDAQMEAGTVSLTSTTIPTQNGSNMFTIAVDMNRMMEYFENARTDFNPPNPTMHTGSSYWFTTKFQPVGGNGAVSAVSAYAGALGSVQGYQWIATGTSGSAAGWFTLFLDSSGNYIGGTMYEDDDNELTILKGSAAISSGTLTAGATLTMSIAGTLTGFTTTAMSVVGTASLTASNQGNGATFTVSYTRML